MSQPYRPQDTNVGPRTYSPAPVPFNLTLPHQTMNPPNINGNNTLSEYTNGNAGPSNPSGPSNDGVNGNGNFDQAALQARIALAQQMAQQGMQQQSQHEQQLQNSQQQGQVQERRTSGPTPDWSQLAANSGVGGIMNGAQGATREALMKQLQALQSSHAAATRNRLGSATGTGQSPPAPSPGLTNQSNPSPGPNQAALQMDNQAQQSPATTFPRRTSSIDMSGQLGLGPPPGSSKSNASPLPPTPSSTHNFAAPSAPTPPSINPMSGATGSPIRPPLSAAPRPMHNLVDQRRQFLGSLVSYHKQRNLKVPPEILNGERDGAIKMGDTWVEVVELFMAVLRVGGLEKVNKFNAESPFWQGFLRARKIPNPLPSPVNLPQPTQQTEPVIETTTDPIQFLTRAYQVWLSGFELQMQQNQLAVKQRAAATKNIRPPPPPGPQTAPSPASTGAPTPMAAPSPASVSAPTPKAVNAPIQAETPIAGPSHQPAPSPAAGPSDQNRTSSSKPIPPPIKIEPSTVPVVATTSTAGATPAHTAKRKYTKRKSGAGSAETSRPATPGATPGETAIERPPTPKRKRYKVEYRPLHLPQTHLAGWDERMVSSTFPRNNIGQPARSIHELESVDMEAIIMGIRSRIPRELGYGLTVLSMLSMGVPEENIHGLPLAPVPELYHELLELLSDATFGEEGYTAWSASAPKKCHLNDMSFGELEQLGQDMDFGLEERRDTTGGQTDVVLSCLNLFRNFSILPENWQLMSRYPEIFETLARITDGRLCRLPYDQGSSTTHKPFSLYELARVRRDAVTILSNLGASIDLRQASLTSVEQIVKVVSSFLVSGFTMQSDSLYGPPSTAPPTPLHSVNRAVEAFCKLSWSDSNREILSKLPSELHVTLFESMIKLLPVSKRQFDHLGTSEEYLGQIECLALSLYSLAFTSPLSTRSTLRHIPGGVQVITRLIHMLSPHGTEYRVNPYGVLVRRLAEILGILNGTSGLGLQADPVGMSFSAVLGDDGGKSKSGNKVIERGWLAFDEERITNSMTTRGLEGPAFVELDNLWWGGE